MEKRTIDEALVRKIADLAQLALTSEEVSLYQDRLTKILDYIEQLDRAPDELDSDWRHDLARLSDGMSTPERLDCPKSSKTIETILENAPLKSGTAFQVPRIIE